MEKIYNLVESAIKNCDSSSVPQLFQIFKSQQAPQTGSQFNLPTNMQYVLKRLINACMSTDQAIRNNSVLALTQFRDLCQIQIDGNRLNNFVLEASNYNKKSHRKNEAQSFAVGRLNVFRIFQRILKNNSQTFKAAKQILVEFPIFEQLAIQVIFLISHNKLLQMKFMDLSPKSPSAKFLYKILIHKKQPSQENATLQQAQKIINEQITKYPEESMGLQYFGKYLSSIVECPSQFFGKYANKFLDDEQQVQIHEIYYILVILKNFLGNVIITQQKYQDYFNKKIIAVWLQQLRVMNKKMKNLAKDIKIQIEQNSELAYKILVTLHQSDIYLDNISVKHPLSSLYKTVHKPKYWKYLYGLCQQQYKTQKQLHAKATNKQQMQEEQNQQGNQIDEEKYTNFNQLAFIIQHYHAQLSDSQISQSLILILNLYHHTLSTSQNPTTQSKPILYILVNIINHLFEASMKKKRKTSAKIGIKMLNLLSKINWESIVEISDSETKKSIKKCVIWVKKNVIKDKKVNQQLSQSEVAFYNFYISLIYFILIYPDEIQTCFQLQMVQEDLNKLHVDQQAPPRKKVKKSEEQDNKKPVHVLIDIFISLMTKPPKFLRIAVHNAYSQIIPLLDESDLGNLLTVITTPDAQFIEEM